TVALLDFVFRLACTGCSFDGNGNGHCQTGDCGGKLACTAYGSPPNTLAEFALNQYQNLDFIDISLVDGFNVPMDFNPTSGCSRGIRCTADIVGQCPNMLKAPGGCNNPCTVFKTNEYCCNSGGCGPTNYSKFFKNRCPDAYSYPKDDQTSTFTCPGGTNYKVIFCP
ncbi:thaumatin-like protein, partial [Elaeis guineensis]|uniref:thaumatin-like protein n=1 Tax=Elaeis guineensis var. tenera TaxID=51953 RepID=UPI003C6D8073